MFKDPFSFSGRIRRTEYALTHLMMGVLPILGGIFGSLDLPMYTFGFVLIPVFWLIIAQSAKRCHDLGNSGFFQLIPFYNILLLFVDSQYGHNRFGPNPKGIGNEDEMFDY